MSSKDTGEGVFVPPDVSETPEPETAKPVMDKTDSGLAWYWWVLIGAGIFTAVGSAMIYIVYRKNAHRQG